MTARGIERSRPEVARRWWPFGSTVWRRAGRAASRLVVIVRRVLGRVLPDVLALELLALAVWAVFAEAHQDGLVFHEADTSTMFYPIFAALGSALARGELLLWSPQLFSGFPLLAEGQTGVLYPPNWLAARLLPAAEGFIWLRTAHYGLAVLFAYLLGRSLRLAAGPSAILGLSFGLGGFMVGQMQHGSVLASAIWLPLVLALIRWGFSARGLGRLRFLLLAGSALGIAGLGVHVQTVVMAGGCILVWIAFQLVAPPVRKAADGRKPVAAVDREQARRRHERALRLFERLRVPRVVRRWRLPWALIWLSAPEALAARLGRTGGGLVGRALLAVWAAASVPLIGMALAAPQLMPLYELSGQSGRATGWTYQSATDYSLPVPNLLTLVFPFFFRDAQGRPWSLWQPWEVTYYAGVVPLALAALGVAYGRRREVLFFLPMAVVATLLALGDYSPLKLYAEVWNLPGINLTRAPARFTYLGVLGIAGLAAIGSQALWDNLRSWPSGAHRRLRLLVVWLAALVAGVSLLTWHLTTWRSWLEREPLWALQVIDQYYLALRRDPGVVDSAQRVYAGLAHSLDLANRFTALPLVLLAALLLLVVCWSELRRARALWQSVLVILVAVDLASFARAYHQTLPIETIAEIEPSGRYLAAQPGLHRVLTDPGVADPKPNKLLPWDVSEAAAYDPLELSRHRVFRGAVAYVDNWLLDLLGVRYRLLPEEQPGQPSYRQTAFNPQHPLVSGGAFNPSGYGAWTVSAERSDELRIVSVLEGALAVPDGEPVGEWVLTEESGPERRFVMLAGRDTAEWTYDDPRTSPRPAHSRARVAFTYDLPGPLPNGARQASLFYTAFPLEGRPIIRRVEFRQVMAAGRMQVFGIGLFNRDRGQVDQFFEREKYRTAFQGGGTLILENRAAFPRAFAVPDAVIAPSAEAALELLAHGAFVPRRQVVLEDDATDRNGWPPQGSDVARADDRRGAPYGEVQVVQYEAELVSVEATTDGGYLVLTDAYYPGWRATVDGLEAPIYRADYLFRAVAIPPGRHLVQFRYQPASFETGATVARLTLALLGLTLLVSCTPRARPIRPSWLRTP